MKERNKDVSRTSSSGVKSLTMLKSLRISSGVLPLIMLATVLHPTSLQKRDLSRRPDRMPFNSTYRSDLISR